MQTSDARTYAITRLPCCTCPTCEKLSFTHRLRSTASARASQRIFAQAALKCVCWQSRTDQQRGYDIHLKRNLHSASVPGALFRSSSDSAATCLPRCTPWSGQVFLVHALYQRRSKLFSTNFRAPRQSTPFFQHQFLDHRQQPETHRKPLVG